MLEETSHGLRVSKEVIKALLYFAGTKKGPVNMNGIGINNGNLCAVDGFCGVRFCGPSITHESRVFSREYCELKVKIGAAYKKDVELEWTALHPEDVVFPNLKAIQPDPEVGISACCSYPFDPCLFAGIQLVAEACETSLVQLSSLTLNTKPILFTVAGPKLSAYVTAMPKASV